MKVIAGIDFETRSAANLKKVGAEAYAQDSSTRVLCAVLARSYGRDSVVDRVDWLPGDPLPQWYVDHVRAGLPVVAHNCGFEDAILRHVLQDWPQIPPEQWFDTSALAAAAALPRSLEGLGAALGSQQQKDMEGNALMLRLCKASNPEPTEEELRRLVQYCGTDVEVMLRLFWRIPRQPLRERMIEVWDRTVNQRGIAIDTELVDAMAQLVRQRKGQLTEIVWTATEDLVGAPQPQPLVAWLQNRGITLKMKARKRKTGETVMTVSLDRDAVTELLTKPDLPLDVQVTLQARLEAAKLTSLAKLRSVTARMSADGRLRGWALYHGAHTGRWSSLGFQVHNLPKPKLKDKQEPFRAAVRTRKLADVQAVHHDALSGMSQTLRSCCIAGPGNSLIGADFNAIEARVLAWLAGQQDVLDVFAAGRDIYMEDAKAIGSDNRDLGKVSRLGLGYGMAAVQFVIAALGYGIKLAPKEARRVVKLWREANPMIVQFWRDVENAVKACVRDPNTTVQVGYLTVRGSKTCVRIVLPSGRVLHYWRPSIRVVPRKIKVVEDDGEIVEKELELEETRFFSGDWTEMVADSTYGGKLVENITQAVARDVLADAGLALELCGYPVVLHVHDSVVAEVGETEGDLGEVASIITAAPAWAPGLPLAAKPYRSKYFLG